MIIHPALLVDSKNELEHQLSYCHNFCQEVDIDIIDWQRTPKKTVTAAEAISIPTELNYTFDLMMDDPQSALDVILQDARVKRVLINTAAKKLDSAITQILEASKLAGISLNPEDQLDEFSKYFAKVQSIQIMTIEPGAQGNPFLEARLSATTQLRKMGFGGIIEVDGGINEETIELVKSFPIDILSVGSAISKANDPHKAYQNLNKILTA